MHIELELARIATGNRAAFSRLYIAVRPGMIRFATGLLAGDREGAEDAVDEAFIVVWQQAARFDGRGSANGWLRRIVRNKAIDWLRKQRETSMSADLDDGTETMFTNDAASPFESAATASTASLLRAELAKLSFEQREAVWMCYFEERPLREIAEAAGCPENTIKTRLFHARKMLRNSLMLAGVDV